jgi:hypothetical protein
MLEALTGLPNNVVGFEAVGEIHSDDYKTTLLPAIEAAADAGPIRFVYVVGDRFEGYSTGASWQDAKLGMQHHGKWHRFAVVTNVDWVRHLANAFGWMMPGDFKQFELDQRDAAITWTATD